MKMLAVGKKIIRISVKVCINGLQIFERINTNGKAIRQWNVG